MGDATGSVPLSVDKEVSSEEIPIFQRQSDKSVWMKVVLWFIPVIFFGGVFFYNAKNTGVRAEKNSDSINMFKDKQHTIYTEQRVQANKLDSISKSQEELKKKVEKVDDKLDSQKDDLALIKARLGIIK